MNWNNGFANVAWSQNDPTCNEVAVVSVTEKAVQLKSSNCVAWFPKSAFKADKHNTCFELQNWFKTSCTSQHRKALGFSC